MTVVALPLSAAGIIGAIGVFVAGVIFGMLLMRAMR